MKTFYEDGLNFSCQQCGYCCRFSGGIVKLSKDDLQRLVKWSGLTQQQFIQVYCRTLESYSGKKYLCLKEYSNGDCIFWDKTLCEGKGGCQAYSARPIQCSTFPFWKDLLKDKKSWNKAATKCPGMNQGMLHTKEEITEQMEKDDSRIALTIEDIENQQ